METIPFVDLQAQYRTIKSEILNAINGVLDSSQYILGDAVTEFETAFAQFIGAKHAIGVGTGLDALKLALDALEIGPGHEVIIPANTYIATALAISAVGATPVLVDCLEDTYEIDPTRIEEAISDRTRALMPVHLYGQSADMDAIGTIADAHGLAIVEDAAQSHGTRFRGRRCGTFGRIGCFSFYPGKNLGAYGDGGLAVTDDDDLAERLRRLRNYGQRVKYEHVALGTNSRLDSIQAAVLNVKLPYLESWNERRAQNAARYTEMLAGSNVVTPALDPRSTHIFHLYVVQSMDRDGLVAHLGSLNIQTGIHYPIPVHAQKAYEHLGIERGQFPVSERLAAEIVSLPMYAELTEDQIGRVVDGVLSFRR